MEILHLIISRFRDWNSHVVFKLAKLSPYDVNNVILTLALNLDVQGILL